MSRVQERRLRLLINSTAGASLLAAACLGYAAVKQDGTPARITPAEKSVTTALPTPSPDMRDRLLRMRVTKTIEQKKETVLKPVAPPLTSLVRVKGILEYGTGQPNEAVIETMQDNQARVYRVGDSVKGIDATIRKIDTAVTFAYDGQDIRLGISSGDRADTRPTATPEIPEIRFSERK